MSKLVVTLAMVLSLTSVACGGSEVVQGKVDHNGVTGVAEGKGSTILRNVPAYDQVRWTQSVGQNRGHVKSGSCCLKRLQ